MIIDFSSLGSGAGKQVDLCAECRYFVKIQHHNRPAQAAWLSGAQIEGQYGARDVRITIQGLKRCKQHSGGVKTTVNTNKKPRPKFMEAAMRSGIDINTSVDDYKTILKQRVPNVRI
jgi:hypothetical protein